MAARPSLAASLQGCFDSGGGGAAAACAPAAAPAEPLPHVTSLQQCLVFASPEDAGARLLRAFSVTLAYRALCWHLSHFGARLVREYAAQPCSVDALAARLGAWLDLACEWGESAWPYSVYTPGANPNFSPPLPAQLLAPRPGAAAAAAPAAPAPAGAAGAALAPPAQWPPPAAAPQQLALQGGSGGGGSAQPAAAVLRHAGLAYSRITPMRCVAAAAWPQHLGFLAALQPMLVPEALCARRGPRSSLEQSLAGFPHPVTAATMVARRCEDLRRSAPGMPLRSREAVPAAGASASASAAASAAAADGALAKLSRECLTPDRWLPTPQWVEDAAYEEAASPAPRPMTRTQSAPGLGFFSPVPREEDPFSVPLPPLRDLSPPWQQQQDSPSSPHSTASGSGSPGPGNASPSPPPQLQSAPATPLASQTQQQQRRLAGGSPQASALAAAAAADALPPSQAAIAAAGAAAHRILWGAPDQLPAQCAAAAARAAALAGEDAAAGAAAVAAAAAAAQAAAGEAVAGGGLLLLPGQGLPHEALQALRAHLEEALHAAVPALSRVLFCLAPRLLPLAGEGGGGGEGNGEGEGEGEGEGSVGEGGEGSSSSSTTVSGSGSAAPLPLASPQIHVPLSVSSSPLVCALAAAQLAAACSPHLTPSPAAKLAALLGACQVLDRAIRLCGGAGAAAGADDLLPAQVWLLVAACPRGFLRVLGALEALVARGATGAGGGQGAYVLTTWRVAASYIIRECRESRGDGHQ